MELIVEIGTEEQQSLIKSELLPILSIIEKAVPDLPIARVIIPSDFAGRVNELTGEGTFRSTRPVGDNQLNVTAKILLDVDPPTILLSDSLYQAEYDTMVRVFVLSHEILHAANSRRFPRAMTAPFCKASYSHNLRVFLDEYFADRGAYYIVDGSWNEHSKSWQNYLSQERAAFSSVLLDPLNPRTIASSVEAFRTHGDVPRFIREITPVVDGVFVSLAHMLALNDQYPNEATWPQLQRSRFVNSQAQLLFAYARDQFDRRSFDTEAGIQMLTQYMQGFGFRLEDTATGQYCHVLDI